MADPLAALDGLTQRLGLGRELTEAETGRAEAALEDASTLVRDEARREWTDPAEVPAAVVMIVLESAKRGFLNPNGYSSETTGPFTVRRDVVGIYLTDGEAIIVRRYREQSRTGGSGLWTQPTTRCDPDGRVFLMDQYGGDPILYDDERSP